MKIPQRLLVQCAIGLSISESNDSESHGFPPWQVNRVTLQVVAALLGQGAGVIFGHDWREDGVMEAVHAFALQMQPPISFPPVIAEASGSPLLRNLIPWPDHPQLSDQDQVRLAALLRVEQAGLPEELLPWVAEALSTGPSSPLYRYLRSRGLTHLRRRLNSLSDARVCVGGRVAGSSGRYPGVIEEALLAVQEHKPLYLAGLLGGATRQIVEALNGRKMPEGFCPNTNMHDLYLSPPMIETNPLTESDRAIDHQGVWRAFNECGIAGLARMNGLSEAENVELMHTRVLDRVIQLVLFGLSRISKKMT